jgi:hypothetical protein
MRDYHEWPELPDPPRSSAERERRIVWHAEHALRLALRPGMPAYHISDAIYSVQIKLRDRGPDRPSPAERDAILGSLAEAHRKIVDLFPRADEHALALAGFDATVLLVRFWSASDAERGDYPRHEINDAQRWARWLRNACHNLSLVHEYRLNLDSPHPRRVGRLCGKMLQASELDA